MKKILVVLFLLFLSSCKSESVIVPLVLYDMNDAYIEQFEYQIQSLYQTNFDLVTYDSQNSQAVQNNIMDELLKLDYKTYIVNPVDRLSAYNTIAAVEQIGGSLIFINREPLERDLIGHDNVYYVGAEAKESARIQAEIVGDLFGGIAKTLNFYDKNEDNVIQTIILKGEQGHQDAEERTKYIVEFLRLNGFQIEILDIRIANFSQGESYEVTKKLMKEFHSSVELFISNNDAMAIGAIEALVEEGFIVDENKDGFIDPLTEPTIPIVGIDGLDEALNLINQGFLSGTVLNDSMSMAKAIVELAILLENDEDLNDYSYEITNGHYIWIPYQKITE